MGPTGTGSLEEGDASGEIFWMKYPSPFLEYFYDTFPLSPDDKPQPPAALSSHETDCEKRTARHPDYPNLAFPYAEVYKYFTVLSDDLCEMGPKSGQFSAQFVCTIPTSDGTPCGTKRTLFHKDGKAVSTSNLVTHVRERAEKCERHKEALLDINSNSSKYVEIDGEQVKIYNFAESFSHHVDLLWLRTKGLSFNLTTEDEFREYVRGFDARAAFPHAETLRRLAVCVLELQREERISRTLRHIGKFNGGPCLGLQLDMWVDTATHTVFAAVTQTTCVVPGPGDEESDSAQIFLRTEVVDFDVFPLTSKTGDNICIWFVAVLKRAEIPHEAVSGVTPDGAADGQCGLSLIADISEKVDTCILHQLQRSVLYSIGLAGAKTKNEDSKVLLKKHNRIVTLTHQSLSFGKSIRKAQASANIPEASILSLEKTATTRWGNQFVQLQKNCVLRLAIDSCLQAYKQENRQKPAVILDPTADFFECIKNYKSQINHDF
ncbi:hypothetical protein CYMTET_48913 [Cymbomonas tetramitiformis]|uniref:Uncharacterized protein n=1 Tax=Cymbomonas tetramitiformis TaxID=36881 RepID=A0AAE0BSD3_9CHLO|nr:hypothetical protein CYMTET_48913 [Cymbomonas tetramitiformis]